MKAIAAAAALLLTVDRSSGFIGTKKNHGRPSKSIRLTAGVAHDGRLEMDAQLAPPLDHLTRNAIGDSLNALSDGWVKDRTRQKPMRVRNGPGRRRVGVEAIPGAVTQLGGWTYARTLFDNSRTAGEGGGGGESDGSDGSDSSAPSPAPRDSTRPQSPGTGSTDASSSSKGSSAAGSVEKGGAALGSGGGDGGDDDGDGEEDDGLDSWDTEFGYSDDFSEEKDSEDDFRFVEEDEEGDEEPLGSEVAVGGSTTGSDTEQEFEVVCDGDVCERRPVAPTLTETPIDPAETQVGSAAGAVDCPDIAGSAAAELIPKGEAGLLGDDGGEDNAAEDVGAGAAVEDPGVAQLVSMGWEPDESAGALAEAGGDVLVAAEALAAREEEDLERYQEGLADLQSRGWDEDVAMLAMREANGNSTAAMLALEEEDSMLSAQFEQSIDEMVEHGWDEDVARQALLMQWQKDIEGRGGGRKAQKQFEKTVKGVKTKGEKEGKANGPKGDPKKKADEPPAPTPAKREDVVFDVTDKTMQKLVLESPVPVILDVYAEWCGPCKQLTPALEEAAMRSGGMFRVCKVDAEKQKGLAEVLDIKAFPSIFGVKDGILLDNFVGILPQDEMQSFMMGVIMGKPPSQDKELREHQKGQAELRGMSRKLAHVAGLAVLGSRKKESLCLKVDNALGEMLPDLPDGSSSREDAAAVAGAKKAARTVITVLMSAYKFPEDPKYRKLSTSSKVFVDVLEAYPPMVEVLRLAGFRHKDGDESNLTLLHRNMAVLASVQDRLEVWNKGVKMPQVEDEYSDDEYDTEDEEDEEDRQRREETRARLASVAKLEITKGDVEAGAVVRMEMQADATLGELFQALLEDEGFDEDLVLTTAFPKRELAASDVSCHSSTLASLGLAPSARLTATNATAIAADKAAKEGDAEAEAARKEDLRAKMMDKSRDKKRKGSKKAGTLFGAEDGIIEVKKGKHREYFGGDSTVTLAAEEEQDTDDQEGDADSDDFGDEGSQSERESDGADQSEGDETAEDISDVQQADDDGDDRRGDLSPESESYSTDSLDESEESLSDEGDYSESHSEEAGEQDARRAESDSVGDHSDYTEERDMGRDDDVASASQDDGGDDSEGSGSYDSSESGSYSDDGYDSKEADSYDADELDRSGYDSSSYDSYYDDEGSDSEGEEGRSRSPKYGR